MNQRRTGRMMSLHKDWRAFIGLLISHRVRFLIVGAHALAANGRPRYTGDLDILVNPTETNANKLEEVFRVFAGNSLADEAYQFAQENKMVTLGVPPLQLQVMSSVSGVTFSEAWADRLKVKFGKHNIGVMGRSTFMKNKRAAGRPKDLLDIALLEEGDE